LFLDPAQLASRCEWFPFCAVLVGSSVDHSAPDGPRDLIRRLSDLRRLGAAGNQNDAFVMRTGAAQSMLVALQRKLTLANRHVAPLTVADLEIDALDQRIRQGGTSYGYRRRSTSSCTPSPRGTGVVVSYRELANVLGRTDPQPRSNTVARHLSSLRRKLQDNAQRPRYVETVSRVGYRFVAARGT
jgi:DNA-binding response OmpR family regulator